MPDMDEPPVKRRPGRPRKNPLPAEAPAADAIDTPAEPAPQPAAATKAKPAPSDPSDERIGQEADDPRCTSVVFPDGTQYRVEDGVIVERMN